MLRAGGVLVAFLFLRLFPQASAYAGNDVLEDPHGADDRAVQASQQQGERYQYYQDGGREGENGRNELDVFQNAEPFGQQACEVDEVKRDEREHHDCYGDTAFAEHGRGVRF